MTPSEVPDFAIWLDRARSRSVNDSLQRVVTALLAAPVVLYLAYLGGWPFAALVAGIGILGQCEFYHMARRVGAHPHQAGGLLLGGLVITAILRPLLWPVAAAALLVFVVAAPILLPLEDFLLSFTVTIAGAVYPTGLLGSLVWLRKGSPAITDHEAFRLVLLVLLIVWATDTAAYYVGRELGTRPLAPTISPNKSWEGTLGGIGAALLVGGGLKATLLSGLAWAHVAALVGIGGGIGQLGDLLESQLKRSTDMDDSSRILPGHGGMLDRFDAMAVAAPLMGLYLNYVAGVL